MQIGVICVRATREPGNGDQRAWWRLTIRG